MINKKGLHSHLLNLSILSLISICIFFFLSIYSLRDLEETERGVYTAFSASFLRDGDLNIINHVSPDARWLVTKSYHHPTNENHGSVIFWMPWLAPLHLLPQNLMTRFFGNLSFYDLAALLRNAFYAWFGILFCWLSNKIILKKAPSSLNSQLPILFLFLLSTSLPLYLLVYPFSAEVTNFFLASILTYLLIKTANSVPKWLDWFVVGLFLGLCSVFKVSFFIFILGFIILATLSPRLRADFKQRIFYLFSLGLGLGLIILLQTINYSIQLGELTFSSHFESLNFIRSNQSFLLETFFTAPNAWLTSSPINLIILGLAIISSLTMAFKWLFHRKLSTDQVTIFALSFITIGHILTTLLALKDIPVYPDLFSSRVFINLVPLGLILTLYFFDRLTLKIISAAVLSICVLLNFFNMTSYLKHQTSLYPSLKNIFETKILLTPGTSWHTLEGTLLLQIILSSVLISILLLSIIFFIHRRFNNSQFVITLRTLTIILACLYTFVTFSNLINNTSKIEKLAARQFFSQTTVAPNKRTSYYDEIVSCLEWGISSTLPRLSEEAQNQLERYNQNVIEDFQKTNSILKTKFPRNSLDNQKAHLRFNPNH